MHPIKYNAIRTVRGQPPKGQFVTLEVNPAHAEVARSKIARAGLSSAALRTVGSKGWGSLAPPVVR